MKIKILLISIITIIFFGCNKNIVYSNFINLGKSWSLNKRATFQIDKSFFEDEKSYNLYIYIRNT